MCSLRNAAEKERSDKLLPDVFGCVIPHIFRKKDITLHCHQRFVNSSSWVLNEEFAASEGRAVGRLGEEPARGRAAGPRRGVVLSARPALLGTVFAHLARIRDLMITIPKLQ